MGDQTEQTNEPATETKGTMGTLGMRSGLFIRFPDGSEHELQVIDKLIWGYAVEYHMELEHEDVLGMTVVVPHSADMININYVAPIRTDNTDPTIPSDNTENNSVN